MNTVFERYWECHKDALQAYGISKAQALKIYTDATNLYINRAMFKAQEFLTRPSTPPSEAIIETLHYVGVTEEQMMKRLQVKWQGSVIDTMKADNAAQFAEASLT